jgi:hypothetical protein
MPRPSGIIGRVSRPDMPACGLFHVRRALEIQGNFTGAAMHTRRPSWVIRVVSGPEHQSMQVRSAPKTGRKVKAMACVALGQ